MKNLVRYLLPSLFVIGLCLSVGSAQHGQFVFPPYNVPFDRYGVGAVANRYPQLYGQGYGGQTVFGNYFPSTQTYIQARQDNLGTVLNESGMQVQSINETLQRAKQVDGQLRKDYAAGVIDAERIRAAGDAIAKVAPTAPPTSTVDIAGAHGFACAIIQTHCAKCHLGANRKGDISLESYLAGTPDCDLQDRVLAAIKGTGPIPMPPLPHAKLQQFEIDGIEELFRATCGNNPLPTQPPAENPPTSPTPAETNPTNPPSQVAITRDDVKKIVTEEWEARKSQFAKEVAAELKPSFTTIATDIKNIETYVNKRFESQSIEPLKLKFRVTPSH